MKYASSVTALLLLLGSSAAAWAGAKDDLLATDRAFAAMSVAKGAHAAFLAYMADDVRLFEGGHPPIVGRKAVEAYYAKTPETPDEHLDWIPEEADASSDGTLGFTRGTWTYTSKAAKLSGYYVTGWRRQADGQYKFILDIGGAFKPAGN